MFNKNTNNQSLRLQKLKALQDRLNKKPVRTPTRTPTRGVTRSLANKVPFTSNPIANKLMGIYGKDKMAKAMEYADSMKGKSMAELQNMPGFKEAEAMAKKLGVKI